MTHSGNFEHYQTKLPPQKITVYHVQPGKLPVNIVNHGKTATATNLDGQVLLEACRCPLSAEADQALLFLVECR